MEMNSTGFFSEIHRSFFNIFAQVHICTKILRNNGLEEGAEDGIIGSNFRWIPWKGKKKVSDAKWRMIQNG